MDGATRADARARQRAVRPKKAEKYLSALYEKERGGSNVVQPANFLRRLKMDNGDCGVKAPERR